jgi:hypothetical protein
LQLLEQERKADLQEDQVAATHKVKLPCFDHMHGYLLFNGKRKEILIILDAIIYCLKYEILQL